MPLFARAALIAAGVTAVVVPAVSFSQPGAPYDRRLIEAPSASQACASAAGQWLPSSTVTVGADQASGARHLMAVTAVLPDGGRQQLTCVVEDQGGGRWHLDSLA